MNQPRRLMGNLRLIAIAAVVALAGTPGESARALSFNFTEGSGIAALRAGTPAQQQQANDVVSGFQAAANEWSSRLSDPFTFNLTIDYQALPAGVLGSTNSQTAIFSYSNVRTALTSSATSARDTTAVSSLQVGPSLDFITNDRTGARIRDNDGSGNNSFLAVSRGNAKAIGLVAAGDTATDAAITFSSNFSFDFNRSDGIAGNAYDFIGVATHEIGHSLGYSSGVDIVDAYSGAGPNAATDLNGGTVAGIGTLDNSAVFSVLDLYRYSTGADTMLGGRRLDLAFGGDSFFSIDGGTTNMGPFSTGRFNGDGQQASHWKDNMNLGIMDPTASNGELLAISALDLAAFDVIGYEVVPEPGTAMAGVLCAGLLAGFGWRRFGKAAGQLA